MTGPAGDPPDLAAPVPVLPICATCGHLRITHRRGRCRADIVPGLACGCSRFLEPSADRLDLDASEDRPA
ncbi:hypothetical protein [Parafrankia sp. Ea1.12]|uniref:hypothetical protein n=1 Tax=Parafrankia sp. Ea1.12 TaxID=573499 RepID=UPI000DD36F15|nr:hypothetical protein [Parafrankia sp. Ea1.12]